MMVVSMSNNTNITPTLVNRPFFEQRDYAWMLATFVLTPLTAAALAVTGFIPTDPMMAAVDGLLVSFMYVGFRVINAWRRLRLFRRAQASKSDDAPVAE